MYQYDILYKMNHIVQYDNFIQHNQGKLGRGKQNKYKDNTGRQEREI